MAGRLGEVYPLGAIITEKAEEYRFFLDSRQDFFSKAWKEGFFEESTVTMLLSPRLFGKTSFLNMLPIFLRGLHDRRIYSFSCLRSRDIEGARKTVDAMLKREIEDGILVLDEINYIVRRKEVWVNLIELAEMVWELKGLNQTVILTSSETSSREVERAFEALHPKILRLPALSKPQTETVVTGVNEVLGRKIKPELIDLIWQVSGGVPPYIRSSLSEVCNATEGESPLDVARKCMWRILDEPYAIISSIQTLTNCPIEHAKITEPTLILMADQFCSHCSIGCRKSSTIKPIVEADLADKYGLIFIDNVLSPPVAFYYNDYVGRKQFSEIAENIVKREREIRDYAATYGRKEFLEDARILLEVTYQDPKVLYEKPSVHSLVDLLGTVPLVFLKELPTVEVLSRFIKEFREICRETVHGDLGIDLEAQDLKLSANVIPINAYVQCKNWKRKIDLEKVGIFHKFEMVLRRAKQIHAAILISASKIDQKMRDEAKELTARNKSVFCGWGEREISTIVAAILNVDVERTLKAIRGLSITAAPSFQIKGGALEYLTLKVFSAVTTRINKH